MPDRGSGGKSGATGDKLADLLVRRLAEEGRETGAPVTVAALCKNLLPYGACRDALGVASKGEYDVALLRFMRDGSVLSLDPELAKAIEKELADPEPSLAFLRNFAAAKVAVHVRPERLERRETDLDHGSSDDLDELLNVETTRGVDEPGEVPDELAAVEAQAMNGATSDSAARCPRCDEDLPGDREVLFCPFCGHDQSVRLCTECGDALSAGWRFCPRCGTAAKPS